MTQKIQLEINALVFELWIVCDSHVLTDGYLSHGILSMVFLNLFWFMSAVTVFVHFFETQCFVACWLFIRSLHHRGHFVGTLKPRLTTLLQKFNALIHLDLRYFWTRSLLVWHQPTSEDKINIWDFRQMRVEISKSTDSLMKSALKFPIRLVFLIFADLNSIRVKCLKR